MTKLSICLVAVVLAAVLDVGLSKFIGHYKNYDQFRGNQIGVATGKCSTLSGLLPDPKSGCCGRHAGAIEDNNEDDEYTGDGIDENEISVGVEHIVNDGFRSDIIEYSDTGKWADEIGAVVNHVVDNVLDYVKERVSTWVARAAEKLKQHTASWRSKRSLANTTGVASRRLKDDAMLKSLIKDEITKDYNSTGLGDKRVVGFIAEGKQVDLRHYPWLVHYSIKVSRLPATIKSTCGGSLISPRFVLTAAHCFTEKYESYNDISIVLGEYNIDSFPKDCVEDVCIINTVMHPDQIIMHKEFEPKKLINDIALMRLRGSAHYTDHIRPICLPPFNVNIPKNSGASLSIAGWGSSGREASPIKLATEVQLVSREQCKMYYRHLTRGQICAAGRSGQDICHGDSGGPIMMEDEGNFYLVGIVSGKLAKASCESSVPALYTNVFAYSKWIQKNMRV